MLVHDSNWADEIRDQRRDTGAWHYVDIPLTAQGYDPRRDCPDGDCVVAQIDKDLRILKDRSAGDDARREALRFLIHFTGDIHQPLHAEDDDDKGGNQVRAEIGRERTNLHRVWDLDVVEALGNDPGAIADGIARDLTPALRQDWSSGTPARWANESHAIAREHVYPPLGGAQAIRLPRDYAAREAPLVRGSCWPRRACGWPGCSIRCAEISLLDRIMLRTVGQLFALELRAHPTQCCAAVYSHERIMFRTVG